MSILPVFVHWLQKIVNFYLQIFNGKSDQLSFLFAMIWTFWRWYYWFSGGMSFPKSDKKDWILSSVPKNANYA
jgi:hypothetical protein